MSKKRVIIIVILLVGLGIALGGWQRRHVSDETPTPSVASDVKAPEHIIFYTNYSVDNGPCTYVLYTATGDRTNPVVCADSAAAVIESKLRTERVASGRHVVKIEADVHYQSEPYTPLRAPTEGSSPPAERTRVMLYIDKLYSAELVTISVN